MTGLPQIENRWTVANIITFLTLVVGGAFALSEMRSGIAESVAANVRLSISIDRIAAQAESEFSEVRALATSRELRIRTLETQFVRMDEKLVNILTNQGQVLTSIARIEQNSKGE